MLNSVFGALFRKTSWTHWLGSHLLCPSVQEESLKGNIFKTKYVGKGELDKHSLETQMVHCEETHIEVRDEVKAAFGQGMEAGDGGTGLFCCFSL